MTKQQHLDLASSHNAAARLALRRIVNNPGDWKSWEEYKSESKLANKHYGIARGMGTREIKKYCSC